MRQVLGPGALGRPRGLGWRGRWEGGLGWGIHVNPWLIHVNVWQKPLPYCKVISLQLIKINEKKKKEITVSKDWKQPFVSWPCFSSSSNRLTWSPPHIQVHSVFLFTRPLLLLSASKPWELRPTGCCPVLKALPAQSKPRVQFYWKPQATWLGTYLHQFSSVTQSSSHLHTWSLEKSEPWLVRPLSAK